MRKTFKRLITVALLLCSAFCIASLLCGCGAANGSAYGKRVKDSISYYYTGADTSTRFFCNSKLLEDKLGGEPDAFTTCDGKVGIARVGTGLYRIAPDGVLMVHPAGVDRALLSLDGNIIVFTTATQVHIYDHKTGELEDIKPESVSSVLSIALSPDGGTVGYTVRNSDGSICSYAHENGSSRKLTNNAYIVGVADGAKFWYYLTPEADLYYATSSKDRKIASEASDSFDFNRDLTEVVFDMNGVTYFSRNGGSAKRIVADTSIFTTAGACFSTQGGSDCTARVRDCGTLTGCVYYNYIAANEEENERARYNLWYVSTFGKATELAKGAYQFGIAEDGKHLTCLVDEALYRMNIDDPGTAKKLASNVYSYLSTGDSSELYCIGYDQVLYYIRNDGAARTLLENAVYCVLTDGGACLCIADFDKTGTLYYVKGASVPEKVAEKVYMTETKPGLCCYYSAPYSDDAGNTVYDLYTSSDGKDFALALEGVKLYSE